jgi:hypothetical protein
MTDDAAAPALRADPYEVARPEHRTRRTAEAPAYEPPPRREAPARAYGSRHRGEPVAIGGVPGRRTVEIRGQVAAPRRRPSTTATAFATHPDRTALWAFLLCLFLVLMAVLTAHG